MSTTNQFRHTERRPEYRASYEFGPFVLDNIQHELLKQGKPVPITPKTYDTLLVLVQNSGRMLSKEELMNTLWPDSFVGESNLTQQVSMIRRALGESANDPRYIVTVPGRGYRFSADIQSCEENEQRASSNSPSPLFGYTSDPSGEELLPTAQNSIVGTETPEQIAAPHPSTQSKSKRRVLFSMVALALLAVTVFAVTYLTRRYAMLSAKPRSLAILPLQNLKKDSDSEFLGFSLADAVITKLHYISSLAVRPSSAVEKYRGTLIDIQSVGRDLRVDTLLTGGFVRDGDDLRITYQLIDVRSEKILGRGTVDLKYDKLLRVQDEVAEEIIRELQLNLSPSEAERIKLDAPISPLAYEYYLRGVDLYGQNKFPMSIKMLEKSTEIAPNYAPAWAYLGTSYTADATFEFGGREQYRRAQAAYERALAIRPAQLDAQIFLANLLIDTGKVEQAVPLLRDALKTNPNHAVAHWELGYAYRFTGMLNESLTECEIARRLDPLVKANSSAFNTYLYVGEYGKFLRSLPNADGSSFLLFYRGLGEYYQKDFERAAKDFDRANELDPTLYSQIGKAFRDSIVQREAEGLETLRTLERKITERGVGDPEAEYKIAQAYVVLRDKVSGLRALRRSVDSGFFSYPYIARDPLLNGIRGEPQFEQILEAAHQRHEAFKRTFF